MEHTLVPSFYFVNNLEDQWFNSFLVKRELQLVNHWVSLRSENKVDILSITCLIHFDNGLILEMSAMQSFYGVSLTVINSFDTRFLFFPSYRCGSTTVY